MSSDRTTKKTSCLAVGVMSGTSLDGVSTALVRLTDDPLTAQLVAFRQEPYGAAERGQIVETIARRSEEHTSELQSPCNLVCRLLLEKKKHKVNLEAHSDAERQHVLINVERVLGEGRGDLDRAVIIAQRRGGIAAGHVDADAVRLLAT